MPGKLLPEPTRKRLVQLVQLLSHQNKDRLTSKALQSLTGWSDSVIRRDILLLGYRGGVSNGYSVQELLSAIRSGLQLEEQSVQKCCIVGLGRLGAALLENSLFEDSPFRIAAGFDSSVNRTEVLRSTFPLYPAARMETIIAEAHIRFAVLAVPDREAQRMAERLEACGICGIVNYTREMLTLPPAVMVENVSPVTALSNLAARQAAAPQLRS